MALFKTSLQLDSAITKEAKKVAMAEDISFNKFVRNAVRDAVRAAKKRADRRAKSKREVRA